MSKDGIKKHLNDDYKITLLESTTSTNEVLKQEARQSGGEWTVVIADSQMSGKGRMARKFYSPENCGIYMSVLLKPTLSAEKSVLITAAAAVAVSEAIEKLAGKEAKIKWVNDVFVENKKVCGILTEGGINTETLGFDWAVLGIGINAYLPDGGFASEIADIAGSVFEKRSADNRNRLIAEVLNRFREYYKNLQAKKFFPEYKKRMLCIGRDVEVIKPNEIKKARCINLDGDCRLQVAYEDGSEELLSSGEISVKLT